MQDKVLGFLKYFSKTQQKRRAETVGAPSSS
jgi:hypothetical protein